MMHGANMVVVRHSRIGLVGLVLLLAACRGGHANGQDVAARMSQSAEDVHVAFLTALRENDREQVLALTVDDQQSSRADEFLQRARSYMDSSISSGPYATGGNLSEVRVIRVDGAGTAAHGWSRWQYARTAICHETELTRTPAGWRVLEFYVPGSDAGCTR